MRRLFFRASRFKGRIVGRAHGDPFLDDRDLLGRTFAGGRHLVVLVLVADHFEQQAFFGGVRIDGGTGLAAFQ